MDILTIQQLFLAFQYTAHGTILNAFIVMNVIWHILLISMVSRYIINRFAA